MKSKKYNSFSLLWKAITNCQEEIWRASKVLLAITCILFVVFYIAESIAQPAFIEILYVVSYGQLRSTLATLDISLALGPLLWWDVLSPQPSESLKS
jgi:hypothetical protein